MLLVLICVPCAIWWHRRQILPLAGAFLDRANALEEQHQLAPAADYLYRYVSLQPDDVEGHVHLAQTFDRSASDPSQKGRAVQLYHQAIAFSPERTDLRDRLCELLLELQQYPESAEVARKLCEQDPHDALAARVLAFAVYPQTKSAQPVPVDSCVKCFQRALELSPGDVRLSTALAVLYRRDVVPPRDHDADQLIDQMVQQQKGSTPALLARYAYRRQFKLANAEGDLSAALKQSPDDLPTLLFSAEQAYSSKAFGESARLYQHVIELAPTDRRGYFGLGLCDLSEKQPDAALKVWKDGIAKTGPNEILLVAKLANLQIEQRQFGESDATLKHLEQTVAKLSTGLSSTAALTLKNETEFLRGKWFASQGDFFQAIRLLSPIAVMRHTTDESLGDLSKEGQVAALIAECYARTAQWDRAATTYEWLAARFSDRADIRLQLANAWNSAGQKEKALQHYRLAVQLDPTSAPIAMAFAQALFQEQMRLPKAERKWSDFREALAKIPADAPDAWRLALLDADYEAASDHPDRAKAILAKAENENGEVAAIWPILALAYEQLGFPTDADRALDRLKKIKDSATTVALTQAELLTRRKQSDLAERVLRDALKSAEPASQALLRSRLAKLQIADGHASDAIASLHGLAEAAPDSSSLADLQQFAELALDTHDYPAAEHWENRLAAVEGQDGTLWRFFRARRLLESTPGESLQGVAQIRELIDYEQSRRPNWPAGFLLSGELSERLGEPTKAIKAYQQAIAEGEQRLNVYERLISLLYQQQRFDEAWNILSQLQQFIGQSQDLTSLAISLSFQQDAIERARNFAQKSVAQRPEDPLGWIWLGQAELLAHHPVEAEKASRKAVQIAPEDVRTWNALFTTLIRTEQRDQAREVLAKLAAQAKLSPAEKAFELGQGYEALGDTKSAEDSYRQAEKLDSKNVAVQRRLSALLLRTDQNAAKISLRHLLEIAPDAGVARRTLATLLAGSGKESEWEEAMQLLDRPRAAADEILLDQRLHAVLLSRRNHGGDRAAALEIMTKLIQNDKTSTPADRLLLATLYESVGKVQAAKDEFLVVVNRPKPEPSHLLNYLEFLLRRDAQEKRLPDSKQPIDLSNEMDLWLQRLIELDPNSFPTLAIRTQILHRRNRTEEIEKLIAAYAEKSIAKAAGSKEKAQVEASLGNLETSLSNLASATQHFQRAYEIDPTLYASWGNALVRENKLSEAIGLFVKVAQTDETSKAAMDLAQALTRGHPTPQQYAMAEPTLAAALQRHGKEIPLLLALTGARFVQGNTAEVARLSRLILAIQPKHVVALNNLASILAEQPESRAEALSLVEQAISLGGNSPTLADTKAMLLFYQEKYEPARMLLEDAIKSTPVDPRYFFHLALVLQKLNHLAEARDYWEQAQRGNVIRELLTPAEKQLLPEFERALEKAPVKNASSPQAAP